MSLKLVQRHGSPFWHIRGSFRGIRVEESTRVSDLKVAEEILVKRWGEIQNRAIYGDLLTRTFAEAALSYLEQGGEGRHLDPILAHFSDARLAQIGQLEIERAARALKPGAGPSTLNRHVYTPISAVLHHAALLGWGPKPVIKRPKLPKGRVRWISTQEAERLIATAAPHLRPLVIFLFSTGARLSEALYLDWSEIDLAQGQATFLDTKNGEHRSVPLHARVVAELGDLPWTKTDSVFRRPAGKIKKAGRIWLPYEDRNGEGGGQVKTAWSGMCRRAGITDFTPHDCRHTWATWHYQIHRDPFQLMALGGWKSVEMVQRYAHVNVRHLAPSIEALWGNGT